MLYQSNHFQNTIGLRQYPPMDKKIFQSQVSFRLEFSLNADDKSGIRKSGIMCTFQILGRCKGRRTGVGVTTVSNSLILAGWVTKVSKNCDKK